MGPVAETEHSGGSEPSALGEKLDNHDQCKQQIQRLKEHLIAMDLEATEEARQHKQEVDDLMAQIMALKAEIENNRKSDDDQLQELEGIQEENEHLKALIVKMEEKSQRDSRETGNLKSCLELSESSNNINKLSRNRSFRNRR
jgi:DNA repair exonuclease SbcCD ATPase subunit